MRCPFCGHDEDRVVDSRPSDEGSAIRRRRECIACSSRFTTYEKIESLPLLVIKKNGTGEPFDR
jgi:transcriptional repressor NrdR